MALQQLKLDHVNVRTTQLDTMIQWYSDILDLRHGERPESSSHGAWLFAGKTAVVHLVEISNETAVGSEVDLKLEHFAFTASDCAGFESTLAKHQQKYQRVDQPNIDTIQINLWDPDGNHIHVDFVMSES